MTLSEEEETRPEKAPLQHIDIKSLRAAINNAREEDQVRERLEQRDGYTKPIAMLHYVYDLCKQNGKLSPWDAFDEMLDFMGYTLGFYSFPLDSKGPDEDLWRKLRACVDFSVLANYEDNFGALLGSLELNRKEIGQFFTPPPIAKFMCQLTVGSARPGQTICDPCVGFGVFLLEAMRIVPDGVGLYGVDIDRRAVHASMVQLEVNRRFNRRDIEYYVVLGNSLRDNFSWSDANRW